MYNALDLPIYRELLTAMGPTGRPPCERSNPLSNDPNQPLGITQRLHPKIDNAVYFVLHSVAHNGHALIHNSTTRH